MRACSQSARACRLVALAIALALSGCAEQRIRQLSAEALAGGRLEEAVKGLQDGVRQYPDSTQLRSASLRTRDEAVNRLITEAAEQRRAGKWDEAQRLLQRAAGVDPQNTRLQALMAELDTERRQQRSLAEAEALWAQKRPDAALRLAQEALKDNPRHAGLLALQRKIEQEQRQSQARTAHSVLTEQRPISLDFRDAGLRTVLDLVSRHSGINFVLDRDIRPDTRITVFLRNARLEDALDLIIGSNQLAKKVVDPQTIVIYPNTTDKQREYQEQVVRVFHLASGDAKGAAAFLKAMLKIREPFVDERSNMLALRESQENIQLAERLVALYDSGDAEVLLEVEVLEVSATRLTELGVKWPDTFSLTPLPPVKGDGLTLGNVEGLGRNRISLGLGGASVHLRREVGDFNTLANPKIRVRNKDKARVLIGDKVPVITVTTGQAGFVSDSVNYLDVGLKLEVEPTIYADDDVAIKVALEVSSLGSAVKTASGTLAYQIGTRNASTLLRLKDGETQLLAGLISRDERSTASRVPGLGDLPLVGRLFSDQTDNSSRTELVLAITPRILRNIRRPDASEAEIWVGTEAMPKLRPVGGLRSPSAPPAEPTAPAAGATSAALAAEATREPVQAPQLVWSGPPTAKVGEEIEISLNLRSAAPLRGLPVELAFDPKRLQLMGVAEGDFFRADGSVTSFTHSEGADGRVNVSMLRREATGASGMRRVLTLRFKPLASGPAELRLMAARSLWLASPTPNPALPAPYQLQVQ